MIHRTFRSLDEPPRLIAFTIRQWIALILSSATVAGSLHVAHVPTKPAITLCVFVIGLPAAMTYVSENGGLQLSALVRAMCRWRMTSHTLAASTEGERSQRPSGVLVLADPESVEVFAENSQAEPLEELDWERWG